MAYKTLFVIDTRTRTVHDRCTFLDCSQEMKVEMVTARLDGVKLTGAQIAEKFPEASLAAVRWYRMAHEVRTPAYHLAGPFIVGTDEPPTNDYLWKWAKEHDPELARIPDIVGADGDSSLKDISRGLGYSIAMSAIDDVVRNSRDQFLSTPPEILTSKRNSE